MFPNEKTTIHDFAGDQFVVDDQQAQWVRDLLNTTMKKDEEKSDPNLGLVLITVDIEDALARAGASSGSDLDALLKTLRERYRTDMDGDALQVGKNRAVQVQILPYPNAGIPPVSAASLPAKVERPTREVAVTSGPAPGYGVRIGVIDTDIDPRQFPRAQIIAGPQDVLATGNKPPEWWMGHATSVAGHILRWAPGAQLDVRSVQRTGIGTDLWQFAGRLASFAQPRDDGTLVQIVNCSMGVTTADGIVPLALERAVAALTRAGVTLVAAVGNHGADVSRLDLTDEQRATLPERGAAMYPAAQKHVCGIGALDQRGEPADFNPSTPGPSGQRQLVSWIDFLAPGVDVESEYLEGDVSLPTSDYPEKFAGWARWSGTSFAAARFTGQLAATAAASGRDVPDALYRLSTGMADAEGIRPA